MRKTSNQSAINSFFFQLRPLYFQIQHSFAKNLKSGTTYRLQVYKGIQKIDEMSEPIKARLIGGKIMLSQIDLDFYVAIFNPQKNVSFTILVFQTKPKQGQVQIAKHIIKSNDYIRQFLNEGKSIYKQDVELLNGFKFTYELFVHSSKIGLSLLVQKQQVREQSGRMTKSSIFTPIKGGYATDTFSQSDADQSSKEGTPPNFKKKLSRRRGHQGKLKIKNASSDAYSQREISVDSKNNYQRINNECDYSFFKRSYLPQQSIQQQQKPQNLVGITRRDSNASEILIQLQPNLQQKGITCIEKIQSSKSQIIQPKRQELQTKNTKKSNVDLFCRIEDINESNVSCSNNRSCSHNRSSHKISIKTRQSFSDIPLLKLKPSMMKRNYSTTSETPQQSAKKQFQTARQFLFYTLFCIVSVLLLYNAITPSLKV